MGLTGETLTEEFTLLRDRVTTESYITCRCCAKHDWCYNHAKCPPLLTYFVPYYWTCTESRPQCGKSFQFALNRKCGVIFNTSYTSNLSVADYRGWKGICGTHLCECDRQFAECLRKYPCPRSRAVCVTSPWR